MHLLFAFCTLLVFQLLGEITVRWLAIPLPGPLAGMLLLFFALVVYKKAPPALEKTANFLIQHLMLLFTPAVAGVMLYFERLQDEWLPFFVSGIVATAITLIVTALCLSWLMKRRKQRHE